MAKDNEPSTEIATVSNEEVNQMMQSDSTGVEMGSNLVFPKNIKIFSDMKRQSKYFKKPEDLSISHDGKLFLLQKDDALDISDLKDKITGTLMKASYGHKFYPAKSPGVANTQEKPFGSAPGMMKSTVKQQFHEENPDIAVQNVIKVVICTVDPDTAAAMMEAGENPFAQLELKGTGYSVWFDYPDKAAQALREDDNWPGANPSKAEAQIFQLIIGSQKITTEYGENYIPTIDVTTNTPAVAKAFKPLREKWSEYSLFGNYEGPVDQTKQDIEDAKMIEEVEAGIEEMEEEKSEKKPKKEVVDDIESTDLPF